MLLNMIKMSKSLIKNIKINKSKNELRVCVNFIGFLFAEIKYITVTIFGKKF